MFRGGRAAGAVCDTDSVFVALDAEASPAAAERQAGALLERVQVQMATRIQDTYRVEPELELELKRIYARFFQPAVRGGTQGSNRARVLYIGYNRYPFQDTPRQAPADSRQQKSDRV